MATIGWLRVLTRIEVRAIVAYPMRTLLVVALVALPVAAIVGGGNLLFVTEKTPEELAIERLGQADLRMSTDSPIDVLRSKLPDGTIAEPISSFREEVVVGGLRLAVRTSRMNLDGLASKMATIIDGRQPVAPHEIAASRSFLDATKLSIGNSLNLSGGVYEIVGAVENPEDIREMAVLYSFVEDGFWGQTELLVKCPNGTDIDSVCEELSGESYITRSEIENGQSSDFGMVFVIGCFALAEAALIVAAAFIVGVRRRQREIGLLAACGASRFQVVTSVLLSAMLISIIGGAIGVLIGLGAAGVLHPWLDDWNGRRNGGFEICWGKHLVAACLGVLMAVGAAVIPAIAAGRMPVKVALSARRPAPGGSSRWLVGGSVLVVIGFGLVIAAPRFVRNQPGNDADNLAMLAIMVGAILGIIGLGICSPWLLDRAARYSSKLPLPWRLAVRETGRFRTRNGPLVTAIVAGMALSVLFATIYQSVTNLDTKIGTMFRTDQILVTGPSAHQAATKIAADLNGVAVARVEKATLDGRPLFVTGSDHLFGLSQIAVDDGHLLKTAGLLDPDGSVQRALDSGSIVSLVGPVKATLWISRSQAGSPLVNLPAVSPKKTPQHFGPFGFVIAIGTLEKHGWQATQGMTGSTKETWLIRMSSDVDRSLLEQSAAIANTLPQTSVTAQIDFKADRSGIWGVYLISLLTGLLVIGIATALATVEAREDQRILATVGAPPSVSRHQAAARSGFLALLGCLLAIPAGVMPGYGLIAMIPQLEFCFPLFETAATAIALPAIAYLATWLLVPGVSEQTAMRKWQ